MTSAGAEFSAPILDALGKHDAAALLREAGAGVERDDLAETEAERDELQRQLDESQAEIDRLHGLFDPIVKEAWALVDDIAAREQGEPMPDTRALRKALKRLDKK